ncbi:hypothetical protein OIU80_16745 [Flavobacterium sp. LS1R47]|jgi:hypothetical protein|uniref:Uncharacterized protein n=1 Tax=Flavobacterium frigoritolerans TaxID=2987686 RepID=A0A9X3C982_9FLAO|nr:hypothetical protein [Flavobacterium frigoritolerans]MCV9933933.1 hypothetical protein [Flavobacterium frigoritolerans]
MKQTLLKNLGQTRSNDVFPSLELKEEIVNAFFPENTPSLVQNLSNVTGAFYGLLLKDIGATYGNDKMDNHSKKLFYELGKLKTIQAFGAYPKLEKDTRAFAAVVIYALYNSSPEYNFKIIKYTPKNTIIELTGVDRYLKILTELGIVKYITIPTLLPFVEGIKEIVNIDCEIEYTFEETDQNFNIKSVYNIKQL